MSGDLEYFQRRVDAYFQCGQRNEPGGRIILDLMRALRKADADLWEKDDVRLQEELETLREAYGRLMRGVEEKINPARWPVVETPPPLMREQYRGPEPLPEEIAALEAKTAAPADWFVWAIDRLREDSKDGNFHRSYRFAQELLKAIDERGCAVVPKRELEKLRADNDKLRTRMQRISVLNAENLADIEALLSERKK